MRQLWALLRCWPVRVCVAGIRGYVGTVCSCAALGSTRQAGTSGQVVKCRKSREDSLLQVISDAVKSHPHALWVSAIHLCWALFGLSLRTKNFMNSSSKQTGAETATTSFHSSKVRGAMLTRLPRNEYLKLQIRKTQSRKKSVCGCKDVHDEKMLREGDDDGDHEPLVDPGLDDEEGLPFRKGVQSVEHLHCHQDGQRPGSRVSAHTHRNTCELGRLARGKQEARNSNSLTWSWRGRF